MRKILCVLLSAVFITMLSLPASGQPRGGPLGDIFQGQGPPPGAVTVLGRSFFGAIENGFGNSLALLVGSDDQNVRKEIGMTDAEANSIRLLRVQMLMNAPQYANRFKTMTEADQQSIQQDLSRDMEKITETLNKAMPQERRDNVQKLAFQTLGGLDSPIISLNSMEVLNLSDDQKKKMESVFDEMREERVAQMESMLKMAEKVVAAGGPQNLSQEERDQLRQEGDALRDQSFATAQKLADRLRQHLTPAQLDLERQLIASRPAFLPPLPPWQRQVTQAENTEQGGDGNSGPGADSWRPGQELPVQIQGPTERRFPRAETTE